MQQKFDRSLILILSVVFSFCAFTYEMWIARLLSSLTKNIILAQSLSVGVFLLGLGFGSYLFSKLKIKSEASFLINLELTIALVATIGAVLIPAAQIGIQYGFFDFTTLTGSALMLATAQIFSLAIGVLSGMEIPALVRWNQNYSERSFGVVLGLSYAGGFFSSILVNLFFIPSIGLFQTAFVTCVLSCLCALALFVRNNFKGSATQMILMVLTSSVVSFGLMRSEQIQQIYLQAYYYLFPSNSEVLKSVQRVERISSRYQEIDILSEDPFNDTGNKILALDQVGQIRTWSEKIYHESLATATLSFHGKPVHTALVIGGGDGLLVQELLKASSIEKIKVVELDRVMIELANTHPWLRTLNHRALKSAKVEVIVQDGFAWLKENKEKFDAIYFDLPLPYSIELTRLYSVEIFRFAIRSLTEDGYLAVDFPVASLLRERKEGIDNFRFGARVLAAIAEAGFGLIEAFGGWESFIYASKKAHGQRWSYSELSTQISDRTVTNLGPVPLDEYFREPKIRANSIFFPGYLVENR